MKPFTRILLTLALTPLPLPASAAAQQAAQATPELTIAGQVLDLSGRPFVGATVSAILENQPPGKGITDARSGAGGEFVVNVRVPGRYAVLANWSNNSWAEGFMPQNIPFYRYPGATARVTVAEGVAVQGVQLRLAPKSGIVSSRIVDASTGLPVDKVRLTRCHAGGPALCFREISRTHEGALSLAAPHVPFTMKIEADDYEDWFAPDGASAGAVLNVPTGESLTLNVALRRRASAAGKAINEAEKREGVHLPAPAQLSPAEGAVFTHFPRRTKLEWSPVEGAVSYAVEVDFCDGLKPRQDHVCVSPHPFTGVASFVPPSTGLKGTTYEFDFLGTQPGRWRVWAVDAAGREGFKSPWRLFVYSDK